MSSKLAIVRTPSAFSAAVDALRREGKTVAFVPTMGALHAGHLSLVTEGLKHADAACASIFVNPRQFAPNEDLDLYPRDEAGDAAKLEGAGCTLLYAPSVADMYPAGFGLYVRVAELPDRLCGIVRPGHFDGVATVVAKLLSAARADVAVFGEKDWQQLAIIRRLVADLDIPTTILGAAIVRDPDGLALSSRNAYLSADERARAVALPLCLIEARDALRGGAPVGPTLARARERLSEARFARIDYVELADGETLVPVDRVRPGARILAAAVIGKTRLIDNLAV